MIVLDENISDPLLITSIKKWYKGDVSPIRRFRPDTVIKDDAMPVILRQLPQPTFVTINVDDFWRKVQPDRNFSVVGIQVRQDQTSVLPSILRNVLQHSAFRAKINMRG